MRHGKTTALKCLPLATELLIVFLTADILWQLLCGRPPFSMWGFLLSGGLMTAGNSLFLQKPRRFWQILLLNVLLCAVWIPLLSRTLDLTYPPLLVIQVPLYLFPLCRGYHWGVTPVTVRHLHGAGEYMGLYGLFYLIVASFAPQLLDRVPVLLALLALDLLAVVGMRTSGRNTIRAGSPFGRLPALQVPAVLAVLAVAACALLLAARGELIPIFQAVGSLLEGALTAVFRFLTSLFQGRSAGSAGMSSAAGGGSEAALPVESASGPAIAPQLVTALLLLSLAALVLAGVAALVRWLWRSRSRIRLPEEDDDDGLVRQRLGRRGLLSRLGQRLRVRAFLLRYAGTPVPPSWNWSTGAPAAAAAVKARRPPGVSGTSGRGAPPGRVGCAHAGSVQHSGGRCGAELVQHASAPPPPGSRCGSCSPLSIEAPARLLHVRSDRRPVRASRNARDSR